MSESPLWTLREIIAALRVAQVHGIPRSDVEINVEVHGISIDSRTVQLGELFVAIRGETHDGHDFVEAAFQAGAGFALVSRDRAAPLQALDLPLLIVPDSAAGLDTLASAARTRARARVVAITGSVGKTSSRAFVAQALAAQGKTRASIRSFNNRWGVALTLANMPRETEFGVFELGMNHAGELTPLSNLVRPHVAEITHVSEAHLEFFSSVAEIALAKAEIFAGLRKDGVAVLGADHPHLKLLKARAAQADVKRIITYGLDSEADFRVDPEYATVHFKGEKINLDLRVLGTHQLVNAAGALAVVHALGLPLAPAVEAFASVESEPGRGVIHHLADGIVLIDESYNANPASMRAALAVLRDWPSDGRKIAILGDMRELGATAPQLHASLAEDVANSGIEMVFLAGDNMTHLAEKLPNGMLAARAGSVAGLAEPVLKSLAPGDIVMVKGSNGVRLNTLVAAIVERFARRRSGGAEGR